MINRTAHEVRARSFRSFYDDTWTECRRLGDGYMQRQQGSKRRKRDPADCIQEALEQGDDTVGGHDEAALDP